MSYTIVISSIPGSGATTIAKLLAEKLSLNFFTAGQLFKDIAKGTYKEQYYCSEFKKILDEKNISIPEYREENDTHAASFLWSTELGKNPEFHEAIDELQNLLAEKGNIVIEGKIAIHKIKKADLKIWIKASEDERAQRTAKRDALILEEAKAKVNERHSREREEWKRIYGFDSLDQEKEADCIIDTTSKTPEQAVTLILKKLNQ